MIIKSITAKETYPLRLSVLKTCDAYIYKYQGDLDKDTLHFGAFKKEVLIGVVSLMKTANNSFKGKQIQLRGMAVATDYQGKSIGKALVSYVKETCKQQELDILWCNAREKAVSFYKKQGFKTIGKLFYIKNVGMHYIMSTEI